MLGNSRGCGDFMVTYSLIAVFPLISYLVSQTGLKFVIYRRMALNFWSSCLFLLSVDNIGVCHYAQFLVGFETK